MKKKTLGTGNSWSLVFTIGLALFNLGIFGMILLSGRKLNDRVRQNFEVQIFLEKGLDENDLKELQTLFENKPFVAHVNGKTGLKFTSKEEAGKKFIEETGEDYARFLGENPLRDAFTIKVSSEFLTSEKLKKIKEEITKIPGVFEVVYVENLVGAIQDNINKISSIALGVAGMLLLTAIWLIRNTVKLSVFSQRFLIRTMELVGAESWFIQKPYFKSMFLRGFGGGILAIVMLLTTLQFISNFYPIVKTVLIPEEFGFLLVCLPFLGAVVGIISTWLSLQKYQGKKLDDLHFY